MKRNIYIISVFSMIAIGIGSYFIYDLFSPIPIYEVKEITQIEDLKKRPRNYLDKKLSIQGNLVVFRNENNSLYYNIEGNKKKCVSNSKKESEYFDDCPPIISIEFINTVRPNEVRSILEIADKNSHLEKDKPSYYCAKVEITGYLVDSGFQSNFVKMNVLDIQQLGEIEFILQ